MSIALTSLGHQQLTVSNAAAGVGLTVPSGKRPCHAFIQCGATNAVRWTATGTAPDANTGIALAAGAMLDLTDPMSDYATVINELLFIRSGASDATLDIEYFT